MYVFSGRERQYKRDPSLFFLKKGNRPINNEAFSRKRAKRLIYNQLKYLTFFFFPILTLKYFFSTPL